MSIAYNGMPIGVTASSKIILLTNIIFQYNRLCVIFWPSKTAYFIPKAE